jgi:iron complex outermembrane recepter protein
MREFRRFAPLLSAACTWALAASPAQAQEAAAPRAASPEAVEAQDHPSAEILVLARKRQESILKVPVVVTALSSQQLADVQLTQVTDLPRLVPGLVIGANLLSVGPQITIRGVGTSSYDPGVDQSISLNIDGLGLGQGLAFGSAMFDVGQVEVLKGPQALFYGKGSPGGVISIRTADPGVEREVIARASYEFEAREKRGELIWSEPLSDTLGVRLAGAYSDADGYFRNVGVPITSTGATQGYKREPQPRNFVLRGTLLWKPSTDLSVRLKANHTFDKAIYAEQWQAKSCPDGFQAFGFGGFGPALGLSPVDPIPFLGGDDCKLNNKVAHVYMNPANFPGITNNGVPFLKNEQNFGTLEINYNLTPEVSLNSTTAYYKLKSSSLVNANQSTAAAPFLAVGNTFRRREFTQELRLESDFKSPLNFTLGAFYEDGQIYDRVKFLRDTAYGFLSPAVVGAEILNDDRASTVDITTYSLFGQLRYKVTDQLELAGGVRWADETRRLSVYDFLGNYDLTPFLPRPRVHSSTFSPEATVTYTPTDDLTLFASYKKGYKSGSFAIAVPAGPIRNAAGQVIGANDAAFDDEKVEGYEAGLKARFFDRALSANLAWYDYRYKGLQVGGIEPNVGGSPIIRTVNAGRARTYGIDFDVAYRPPSVEGLSLNASVNWNHGRYIELNNIPCYEGQTVAQGCNLEFSPFPTVGATPTSPTQAAPGPGAVVVGGQSGYYTAQDLSGQRLIRSPEWAANFGFDYEMPVGDDLRLRLTNNNQYSSSYPAFLALNRPNRDNFQSHFFKIDASLALKDTAERWEVALVGKNLTDKVTASNCSAGNFAGGNIIGGSVTGGTTSGPTGFGEVGCFAEVGRAVYVRLTVRPFN